jgi:hypothetical protein
MHFFYTTSIYEYITMASFASTLFDQLAKPPNEEREFTLPYILVMAIGLKDQNGSYLADYVVDPVFVHLAKKEKPCNVLLNAEIQQCWNTCELEPTKKPGNQWLAAPMIQWLKDNPIVNTVDITYLTYEIHTFKHKNTNC